MIERRKEMENSRKIQEVFKMAMKYDIFRRSINLRSGTCTTKNRAIARYYYWRSFRITARNPSKDILALFEGPVEEPLRI